MTSERRDSFSEDWEELDNVGSVMSSDGSSRTASPAPLEEYNPAIVSPADPRYAKYYMPLALRPKDDKAVNTQLTPTTTGATNDAPQGVAPSESRSSQPPQNKDVVVPDDLITLRTISRQPGDLPMSWNGQKWVLPPSVQEQKDLGCHDEVSEMDTGRDQGKRGRNIHHDNPDVHLQACSNTMTTLANVANLAYSIGGNRISTMSMIHQTCGRLLIQTKELKHMLKVYRTHWAAQGSNGSVADIPVRPDVLEWIYQLRDQLFTTTQQLETARYKNHVLGTASDIPLDVNSGLARCGEGLGRLSNSFDEVLPILRQEFDTFTEAHLAFQPTVIDYSKPRPIPRIPIKSIISRIHKEFCDLQDCLVSLSYFLKEVNTDPCFDWIIDPAVTNLADHVIDIIAKTLENDPPEWLESHEAVLGGLTYQQFVNLDADMLHLFFVHLKWLKDELDVVPDEDGALSSWKKVRDYQVEQLARGGKLEEIRHFIDHLRLEFQLS
ncbi:hypothetical protein FPOAC2_07522 [Fusarium poae]|uniref:hypothetical protein n=1 Tax=Fusarium poae TaxID=36050 RepID=UPI001CE8A14C|nr:hypothetical protein FPOAC1_007611 [Fusarium poae]KAG8668234.1 hypothetical protein FPOAC1_007611 [Fusarium poae]